MLDDFGKLSVRVATASGALPIAHATVRVVGAEEENVDVFLSLLTDIDGTTVPATLPAPSKSYSDYPNPPRTPYSIYDLSITANGYTAQTVRNVSIFPGIYALQTVNMIPVIREDPEDGDSPANNPI